MPEWLTWTIAVLSVVFGGGGVAALYKARKDARLGVRQQETAEDAAWDERWKGFLKAQTESLLQPMQAQVTKQGETISEQGKKIERLESEIAAVRTKYWRAIQLARSLYAWIARHMPDADPPPPAVPPELADDI